jgi:formyl-CoA transferase
MAKPVLRIDLRRPEGQGALRRLVAAADVLVHNHRPQRARELGFDLESARALNPRLVHHQVHSYGPDGPLAGDPAFDQLVGARTGLAWLQGGMTAGNPPVLHNGSIGDLPAAQLVVAAVCAGLLRRQTTGRGTGSWTTLLEAGFLLNWSELAAYDGRPRLAEGGVDHLGPDPTRRLYRTSDDWVFVGAGDEGSWARCAGVLGIDLGPFDEARRSPAEGALGDTIGRRLAGRTSAEWEADAVAAGAPVVAARYDATVSVEPHVQANGYEARGVGFDGAEFASPGYFVQVDGQAREGVLQVPDWDHGGPAILAAVGYQPDEIEALAREGVIPGGAA